MSVYDRYVEGDKRDPYFEVKSLCLDITNFISGAVLPSEDKLVLMSAEVSQRKMFSWALV